LPARALPADHILSAVDPAGNSNSIIPDGASENEKQKNFALYFSCRNIRKLEPFQTSGKIRGLHFPSTGFTLHDNPDMGPNFFPHFGRNAAFPVGTADVCLALVQYFFFCLGPRGKRTVLPEVSAT
jgi:hypothetical protein